MAEKTVNQRLANYLQIGDESKIKVVCKSDADETGGDNDNWDKSFEEEMERRSQSFVDGTAKTYTWEETKRAAIEGRK